MEKPKKLLLVGGGSGGHVVPVFELYKRLKQVKNLSLLVVGGGGEIEEIFYSNLPEYRRIFAGKMHRVITWRNLVELSKLIVGFFQSFFLLVGYKPDLIFSKGGFVSLPIIFWARILKVPYFIHESDIEIGITNAYAVPSALKVFVGYPLENYKQLDADKLVYSGQLISQEFLAEEKYDFGLENNKKTLVFLGGSQGSMNLNKAVLSIPKEAFSQYNIIHQTGQRGIAEAQSFKSSLPKESCYSPFAFLGFLGQKSLIKSALSLSDLVVTRAGATTIAEVTTFGKPMILIPYKHAASDHQNKNTLMLLASKAVLAISDDDLDGQKLFKTINDMMEDEIGRKRLVENCQKAVKTDGLEVVMAEIKKKLGEL